MRATDWQLYCRHHSHDGQRISCAAGIDIGKVCPSREAFTREEVAAKERAAEEAFVRMLTCLAAILAGASGSQGEVTCPTCGTGTIKWLRVRSNGHLRACCTTNGCFQAIE